MTSILRGVVETITGKKAKVATFKDEVQEDVLRMEPMGFSSTPSGGDGIMIDLNGDPSRRVLVAILNENTPVAEEGETLLFDPETADFMISLTGEGIELKGDPDKMTIDGKRIAKVGDSTSDGAKII